MTLHAFETLPSVSLSRNSPTLFLITFCSVFIGHSPVARSAQFIRECQTKSRLVQTSDLDQPLIAFDGNPNFPLVSERKHMPIGFSPLNQHDGVAVEHLVQAEGGDLIGALQPIKVDMINVFPIFVHDSVGGTGDFVDSGCSESGNNSFR